MLMSENWTAWAAILLVASLTLSSRLAGAFLMQVVKSSPATERFLDALSTSVIAALVASIVARGDLRMTAAASLAAVAMLIFGRPVWAILSGMLTAAVWSQFVPI